MKRSLGKAALLLGSIMATWLICEFALHYTEYKYLTFPFYNRFPNNYFHEDPNLGADHTPNQPPRQFLFHGPEHKVFTNDIGCFDYNQRVREGYVLVIGDSVTWGYAPLEAKWTTILERLSGKQILKCGVTGTGPKYQLIKARKVIEKIGMRPDAIIVMYTFSNDFNDDVVFPGYTVIEGQRVNKLKALDLRTGRLENYTRVELTDMYWKKKARDKGIKEFLRENLVTVALLKRALISVRGLFHKLGHKMETRFGPLLNSRYQFNLLDVDIEQYPWVEKAFLDHVRNIRNLHLAAESYGAKFILFSHRIGKSGSGVLHSRLCSFLANELPYYYDVGEYVRMNAQDRATVYRFDIHWNTLGNRLAAEGIYRYLIEKGVF